MRFATIGIGLFVLLLGAEFNSVRSADAAKDFFNGKDTSGWEGLPEYWTVKDGMLIGHTPPEGLKFNTFLCSKKQFTDFELKFQVRLRGETANSGVQIRSQIANPKTFAVKGPQCDMGQQYWGSLYGELFGGMMQASDPTIVSKVLKKDDFNDYYIKCVGKHVTIKLNGETTVDKDFENLPATGIIAWQLHGGKTMEAVFKNIEFKDLGTK